MATALQNLNAALAAFVDETDEAQKAAVVAAAAELKITDFSNVSNDMARQILNARGVAVKFQEKTIVNGSYDMKTHGTDTQG
jgi:hypothetical protein